MLRPDIAGFDARSSAPMRTVREFPFGGVARRWRGAFTVRERRSSRTSSFRSSEASSRGTGFETATPRSRRLTAGIRHGRLRSDGDRGTRKHWGRPQRAIQYRPARSGPGGLVTFQAQRSVGTSRLLTIRRGRREPEALMRLLLADVNVTGGARRWGSTAVLQAACVGARDRDRDRHFIDARDLPRLVERPGRMTLAEPARVPRRIRSPLSLRRP